jgi:hypothetical protein
MVVANCEESRLEDESNEHHWPTLSGIRWPKPASTAFLASTVEGGGGGASNYPGVLKRELVRSLGGVTWLGCQQFWLRSP